MAVFAKEPTPEPICTPDHHLGDDGAGRCSVCNERLAPNDLALVGLLLMVASAAIVLAIIGLAIWWLIG